MNSKFLVHSTPSTETTFVISGRGPAQKPTTEAHGLGVAFCGNRMLADLANCHIMQ